MTMRKKRLVSVSVWDLTDAEIENLAIKYAEQGEALHAAELRRFGRERRLTLRAWLQLHTHEPPPFPAELLDRPMGHVRPGPASAVGRWLHGILAEWRELSRG